MSAPSSSSKSDQNWKPIAYYPSGTDGSNSQYIFLAKEISKGKIQVVVEKCFQGPNDVNPMGRYDIDIDKVNVLTVELLNSPSLVKRIRHLVNERKCIPHIRGTKVFLDPPPTPSHSTVQKVTRATTICDREDITNQLLIICSFDRMLLRLSRNPNFTDCIRKYESLSSEKNPIKIVKELTNIELINTRFLPEDSLREILVHTVDLSNEKSKLVFQEKMSKIDLGYCSESHTLTIGSTSSSSNSPSSSSSFGQVGGSSSWDKLKPISFLDYVYRSVHGYFLPDNNIDMGETVLSHLFYLCDRLESSPHEDESISRLFLDLKRSLSLAFLGELIGREVILVRRSRSKISTPTSSSSSCKSATSTDLAYVEANKISKKIYEIVSKMNPGERLFLPMGCKDHATLLIMEMDTNGNEIIVRHINTGYQNEEHSYLQSPDQKSSLAEKFKRGSKDPVITFTNIYYKSIQRQTEIITALTALIVNAWKEKTTMANATHQLMELAGGRTYENKYAKGQKFQNCSYEVLLRAFEDLLTKDSYKKFRIYLIDRLIEDCMTICSGIRARVATGTWDSSEVRSLEDDGVSPLTSLKPPLDEFNYFKLKTNLDEIKKKIEQENVSETTGSPSSSSAGSSNTHDTDSSSESSSSDEPKGGMMRRLRRIFTKNLNVSGKKTKKIENAIAQEIAAHNLVSLTPKLKNAITKIVQEAAMTNTLTSSDGISELRTTISREITKITSQAKPIHPKPASTLREKRPRSNQSTNPHVKAKQKYRPQTSRIKRRRSNQSKIGFFIAGQRHYRNAPKKQMPNKMGKPRFTR